MADETRRVDINLEFNRKGDKEAIGAFEKLRERVEAIRGKAEEAVEGFRQMGKSAEQAASKKFNSTNFGSVGRGLAGGVGQGGLGDIANSVDDLKDLYEQIKGVGTVSSIAAVQSAAAAGGLSGMLVTLGPIALALGAVSLAVKSYTDFINAQKASIDNVVAALKADTDIRLSNIEIIRTTSSEQIKATLEVQRAKLAEIEAEKAIRAAQLEDFKKRSETSFSPTEVGALNMAIQVTEQAVADLTTRETELANAVKNSTEVLLPAIEAREKEAAAAQKAAEFIKAIPGEVNRLVSAFDDLKKANADIATAEEERAKAVALRARDDIRSAQVADLERKINAARETEARNERAQRIADLRKEQNDVEAEVLQKGRGRIEQINQQYMQNELKALNSYLVAERRATADYNRDRVRQVEDLYDTLKDLSGKRDVAAFVSARRTGLKGIRRNDEDFGTEASRRFEDYQAQRREALAARNQAIADVQTAGRVEVETRKAQLQERIALETEAGQTELKQSEVLTQQLAQLRQRFAAEDLTARRRSEDETYRMTLGKLNERKNAIASVISSTFNPAVTAFYSLGTAIVDLFNRARTAASAPMTGSAQDVARGRNYITAYATGTPRVPRSGIYHLDKDEAVLNRRDAADYRAGRMPQFANAGRQVVVQVQQMVFGEVATPSDVNNAVDMVFAAFENASQGMGG
jgi:hypothetical protein